MPWIRTPEGRDVHYRGGELSGEDARALGELCDMVYKQALRERGITEGVDGEVDRGGTGGVRGDREDGEDTEGVVARG